MAGPFLDMDGNPVPTFEEEIKSKGYEEFVLELLQEGSWCAFGGGADGDDGDYEAEMLEKAEEFFLTNPRKVNLAKIVKGKFNFSDSFRAPAFHAFLQWYVERAKFIKHPTVTAKVLNTLDNKGRSALWYCHDEHYQAGFNLAHECIEDLVSDKRFCCLDFPLFQGFGGGFLEFDLPAKKAEALVRRNIALDPRLPYAKRVKNTVNAGYFGVSFLHSVCEELIVKGGTAPKSLIRLIRSHPQFKDINRIAKHKDDTDDMYEGLESSSCVAAVLRKPFSPARAEVVKALLEPHPSGDARRNFKARASEDLPALASSNGYPAAIVALLASQKKGQARSAKAKAKAKAKARPKAKSAASPKQAMKRKAQSKGKASAAKRQKSA